MAEYIIVIAMACFIGLLFILRGIRQRKSESPVTMNTGEKPLKPEQLSNVKAWNTGHGNALIVFGIAIAVTVGIFPVILNHIDVVTVTIVFMIAVVAEIVGLEVNHCRLERMYKI